MTISIEQVTFDDLNGDNVMPYAYHVIASIIGILLSIYFVKKYSLSNGGTLPAFDIFFELICNAFAISILLILFLYLIIVDIPWIVKYTSIIGTFALLYWRIKAVVGIIYKG